MMDTFRPIQKLSAEVIGQIAAGEVVERPASAVKELVENSIDAGATAVTVELKEGGISYLRVSDNGRGIPASQIRMAFERHATSKLSRAEDLFDVHTLGFRGEALASIAAVSRVTLTTRTASDDFGVRAQVEAGDIKDIREAATPVGTTILVQDLFANIPVRLKFLKKPSLEAAMVSDYMMRLILSRPDIAFRFVNQGKTVYQSVGDGQVESALYAAFGKDAMRQMKKVHGTMNGVILDGFIGVGELSRGNRQLQSFFVNGRYFRDAAVSKALENACQGFVMIGKFPICALYLQIPYSQVDVNVHPNKLEVRFQNLPSITQAIETLAKDAVRDTSMAEKFSPAPVQVETEEGFTLVPVEGAEEDAAGSDAVPVPESVPVQEVDEGASPAPLPAFDPVVIPPPNAPVLRESYAPPVRMPDMVQPTAWKPPETAYSSSYSAAGVAAPKMPLQESPVMPASSPEATETLAPEPLIEQETLLDESQPAPLFRFFGVAFDTFWLFEEGERLLWVDQHAAHERMLYDKFWKQYEGGRVSQQLLAPQLVQLAAHECALVESLGDVLTEAGFDIEPFDETAVAVHAIPTIFGQNASARELLLEALDEWQAQRGQVTRERMRRQVIQMACKKAIKAGDKLSDKDVAHLLHHMLKDGVMPTCPHGRPIVTEMTRRDLEKRFKRV